MSSKPVYSNLPLLHTHTSTKLNTIIKEINPFQHINTNEFIGEISNTILFDNKIRFQLKIFKIWFVFYRIRQRILKETTIPLSYFIYQNTLNMIKIRSHAIYSIQKFIKNIKFNEKLKKELKYKQKLYEIYIYINNKKNYKIKIYIWNIINKYIIYKYKNIIKIQTFFRILIAKKKYISIVYNNKQLIKKELELKSRYHIRILKQCMYVFSLYYCIILKTIITKQYTTSNSSSSNSSSSGSSTNIFNILKIKERNRFQNIEISSQPQNKKLSSRETALLRLQIPTQSLKQSKTQELLLNRGKKPSEIGKNIGFFETLMSRQHLIRLKETETFIYDCINNNTTTSSATTNTILYNTTKKPTVQDKGENELHPQLTEKELIFCIENATVLYCQCIKKTALRLIVTHFSGSKLVLRSGEVTVNSIHTFLPSFLRIQHSTSTSTTSSSNNNYNEFSGSKDQKSEGEERDSEGVTAAVLALQLASLSLGMSARLALIHCLADHADPPSPVHQASGPDSDSTPSREATGASGPDKYGMSRISELSIDMDTFGLLGAAVLLASLQVCILLCHSLILYRNSNKYCYVCFSLIGICECSQWLPATTTCSATGTA